MFTTNIISKEVIGNQVKVVATVTSQELCIVEGKQVPFIERGTDYHTYLHENGITHSHTSQTAFATVFIDAPFTEEKLDIALLDTKAGMMLDIQHIENFQPDFIPIQENATADGEINRLTYEISSAPSDVIKALTDNFPDVNLDDIKLICSPAWNSLLEKTVITVLIWKTKWPEDIFNNKEVATFYRKYCLEDKKYFDKCYVATDEDHPLVPEGCEVRFKSFNTHIQDGLDIPDFVDYYFYGDADYVEKVLDLPYMRGKVSTQYGITIHDNKIVRKKQYCYDEDTSLADWI